MKFLIDECLSVSLEAWAVAAGYPESAHVTYRGMAGWADHKLMRAIIEEDWTFVTRNSDDFRPKAGSQSQASCYVGQPIHAGLVCLNFPGGTKRADQQKYFQAALNHIGNSGDLVNQILEVDPDNKDPHKVVIRKYDFP